MNEHGNPIEFLIDFAWANGADRFIVNNAKDELNKLRDKTKELEDLKRSLVNPIAWARINSHGELYSLSNNSLDSKDDINSNVVSLYAKKNNVEQAVSSNSRDE
jgi:hypothetical protein